MISNKMRIKSKSMFSLSVYELFSSFLFLNLQVLCVRMVCKYVNENDIEYEKAFYNSLENYKIKRGTYKILHNAN